MKKRFFVILGILLLLVEVVSVSAKNTAADLFQADENLAIESDLDGTAFMLGNDVSISGNINGIGFILGNSVNLSGSEEYLFLLGNEIQITGTVANDAFILGNIINIDDSAILGRDAYIFASEISISGIVERNLSITADIVTLDGTYNGDIFIDAIDIIIKEGTVINGTLEYNEDANVEGLNSNINSTTYVVETLEYTTMDYILDNLYSLISRIILSVVIVFVLNKIFNYIKDNNKNNTKEVLIKCGKGLLVLVGIPIIGIILLFINFFSSISVIMLILYAVILYLASLFTSFIVGYLLDKYLLKKNLNNYLLMIIGVIIIKLISLIPVLGGIISFITFIYGLGVIADILIYYHQVKIVK